MPSGMFLTRFMFIIIFFNFCVCERHILIFVITGHIAHHIAYMYPELIKFILSYCKIHFRVVGILGYVNLHCYLIFASSMLVKGGGRY